MNEDRNEDAPQTIEVQRAQTIREKRKASASPGSDVDGAEVIGVRRPVKARIIESVEAEAGNHSEDTTVLEDNKSDTDGEEDIDIEPPVSPLEKRVTRESTRKSKIMADFSKLKASRNKKTSESTKTIINEEEMSQTQKEERSDGSNSSERIGKYISGP